MNKPLLISAPSQGIAQSPLVGFEDVRNLDISRPGVVTLNNPLAKVSVAVVTDQINWIVRHPITTTEVYALGATGEVYKSTDSGATWAVLAGHSNTDAHGNGLAIWKNYLFVARDTHLDICGDGTATGILAANWTLDWDTDALDTDVLWHPMLVSKNDSKLYIGAGRYVASMDENTGQTFAPGTPATYTFTAQALDLPTSYRIKCIEELGNNLMLGTWQGTAVTDIRIADIFPWDRSSVSFGQPIVIDDYGVHAMKNNGNSLIVLAGTSGTIRRCDGVNAYIIGQLPIDLTGGKYLEWYPGALINYKNKVFFGVGTGGTWSATNAPAPMGVYSLLQTGRGNILNFEHTISAGTDGSAAAVKASALLPITRDTLLAGWRSDTTYGIDLASTASYTTSYGGYFITPLYRVGSNKALFKLSNVEFSLVKTLATNEGIKIEYRNNLTDSFTTLNTYPQSTIGSIISWFANIFNNTAIPPCEWLQLRISLTGVATSPSFQSLTIQ